MILEMRPKFTTLSLALLMLVLGTAHGKSEYYMDNSGDCGFAGAQDLIRGQTVNVYAKSSADKVPAQSACRIVFLAADTDATIKVDFTSYTVTDCTVSLTLQGDATGQTKTYSCHATTNSYYTNGRNLILTLFRTDITSKNYNFQLTITPVRADVYPLPSDSNPVAVGMVVGIVGSVFGVIFIIACIGICCFRKYRAGNRASIFGNASKAKLTDSKPDSVSVGYTNESMHGSPTSKKKLLAPTDSSSDSAHSNGAKGALNLRKKSDSISRPSKAPPAPPAPVPAPRPDLLMGTKNNVDNRDDGGGNGNLKNGTNNNRSSMLNALHSNPKFRNSFKENEKDAEERAKRISSSSFDQFGQAPKPPGTQENRQAAEKASKMPRGRKQQSEVKQLPNVGRGRHSGSSSSSSEVSVATYPEVTKKTKTTHSLRPDRRGPRGPKKQTASVSSSLDPEPRPAVRPERERIMSTDRALESGRSPRTQRDRFLDNNREEPFEKMGSGRYSKRSNGRKSPRPGRSSGRGFSHRRGRSMDQLDSRPTTPSMYGSMEDLDLPGMKRSTSKQSLYSSRSSLYDRRGRRRKGSFTDSVASYIRDDISVGRHYDEDFYSDDDFDGYEKPLNRRDKERLYRSDNDLGRKVRNKEIATQTLRETATQTGVTNDVTVESKRLVKKKRRSKSLSTAGTQTKRKEKKAKSNEKLDEIGIAKTRSNEKLDEVGKGKGKSKTGTKRSKSVPDFSDEVDVADKSKPVPKPRKSQSAAYELEENAKTASQENLPDPSKYPYYPQSEGFVPQPVPLNQQGYPVVAPPGYLVKPAAVPGLAAGYPGQGMPQRYPVPLQHSVPPVQIPVQGQRQPRKSNWEMLCEMTEGEYQRNDVETGSVASSVFTNNPASVQGYGAPHSVMMPPNYSSYQFYPPYQQGNNQTPPLPPMPLQSIGDYENAMYGSLPGPPPQDYENENFGTQPGAKKAPPIAIGRKQSSWDQLKQLTEQPKPVPVSTSQSSSTNSRTESVV